MKNALLVLHQTQGYEQQEVKMKPPLRTIQTPLQHPEANLKMCAFQGNHLLEGNPLCAFQVNHLQDRKGSEECHSVRKLKLLCPS